jgi:hypothetical protein
MCTLISSIAWAGDYENAVSKSKARQYAEADVLFERAWSATPTAEVAYSWCSMLVEAKQDKRARVVCAKVDQAKLQPVEAARVKRFLEVLPTDSVPKPTKTINNNCKNSVCAGESVTINNSNGPQTEKRYLSATGYAGIGAMIVGAVSMFWLQRELSLIDDYNRQGQLADNQSEFNALKKPHEDAQWRGRAALGGVLLFGVGGTILLVSDLLSVETVVKHTAVRISPSSIQVKW